MAEGTERQLANVVVELSTTELHAKASGGDFAVPLASAVADVIDEDANRIEIYRGDGQIERSDQLLLWGILVVQDDQVARIQIGWEREVARRLLFRGRALLPLG